MPKRDAAYMRGQRRAIAEAALTVLLDKGVYGTSLRDICRAAGISNGALYTHFATREEVITAACALDHAERLADPPRSWDAYVGAFFDARPRPGTREAKRVRLSLQFVAELTQLERNPEGLSPIYAFYRQEVALGLTALKECKLASLPLGLDETAEIHIQLFAGAMYQLAADRELPVEQVASGLRKALTLTAGSVANEPSRTQELDSAPGSSFRA